MELKKEKSFPRGGKKPALFKSSNNSSLSFFRKPKVKSKAKSTKKVKQSEVKNATEKIPKSSQEGFIVKYVEDLKPSIIQDGMLILGIVSKISERIVIVSLPGGLRGAITIANVSEFYRNIIESSSVDSEIPTLMDIFQLGDVLPVKVLSASEKHYSLMLTCDPKMINEKLSYNMIDNGLILTGSVKSQEDHGFIIDFGIEHVYGFLNYEKINKNVKLKIGQIIRCCVIKCSKSPGSCNAQLSVLKNDMQSAFIKKNSTLPVFCFIPGLQFEVTVKKILTEGVEVSCASGNSIKGYIHEDHFLKKFSNPTDLEIDRKDIATLLYVKPMVNFLYFKIMPKKDLEWPFHFGEIVGGKVVKVRRSGVLFKINEGDRKAKCFVPLSKLQGATNLQEKSDILHLYPINKKVSKIRLQNIDFMGRYYVGATDKASVSEKYFSISDIKCGEVVSCQIVSFGKSTARLEFGRRLKGVVAYTDMTDVPLRNPALKFKVGQKVKARVLEVLPEKLLVRLTMKPTLLKEKKILCDSDKYNKKIQYLGTVFKIMPNKILVKFFNHINGMIQKHLTPYPDAKSLTDHFYIGQLVKCFVVGSQEKNRLLLSLVEMIEEPQLIVGKKYDVEVANKTERGLFLNVIVDENKKCRGYLPSTLLTLHRSLVGALHATYTPGEKLSAYCIANDSNNSTYPPLFGAEEVLKDFYEGKSEKELQKLLTEDSVLPFLFKTKNRKTNRIYLISLIPNKNVSVMVVKNDFPEKLPLFKHELVYGKILNIQKKKVQVSTQVRDVWDRDFHSSLDLLDSYLKTMTSLVLRQKNKLNAYNGHISLGGMVKGTVEEVKTGHAIVRTEDGDLGIAEGKFERGQNINGKIVWIDGPEQIFYVKTDNDYTDNNVKRPLVVRENQFARGKVSFVSEEVIVLDLRGRRRGELAFIPRKRHLNDLTSTECIVVLGEELKVWITRKNSNYLLAMDRRIVALQEKIIWKKSETRLKESVQSLKRKLESEKMERLKKHKTELDTEEIQVLNVKLSEKPAEENAEEKPYELVEVKEEVDSDNDAIVDTNDTPLLEFDDVDIKSEVDTNENEEEKQVINLRNDERIELSSSSESEDEQNFEKIESSNAFGVGFNWDVLNNPSLLTVPLNKDESSSEDEDEDSKHDKKKRRRLTAVEKREKAKSEEERLRYVEERLMDTEREPENVDDFDRAVLADPNSSALWLKYMAFHIQGTEIEKARAVAKRALKAISFREEQEKLNIWIALLNLENMYGSEDSLSKTVSEALQVNEPYKIHLHLLNIHGQSNKLQEMEKLGNFMLKKYKDIKNLWCDVAAAYFSVGKVESARNVLQKALTVVDKSQHVPVISKFAQLENQYGSPERAQTLYESILASFPKRVDIWCCYVDMLIKSNLIDLARQVLERATSQSLRPRKMKTLFKKFIAFEEVHGTPENVEKVREAAVEYVQTLGGTDV